MPTETRLRGRPKSFVDKSAQNVIQSLDRALAVLETLESGGAMTLSEIAAAMAQSPATIYRVLSTFELRGVVEVDPAAQTWSIGPAAFRLGAAFLRCSNVVERSRPVMRRLMEASGETSNLGIERSGAVMFVSQVETDQTIRAFFPPGTLSPMHASGIGKALLSCYSDQRLARFLKRVSLEEFTPQTITDHKRLSAEMAKIREVGYAFDNEEKTFGMRCIAAPILNFHGEAVAGILVSGPSHRITLDATGTLVRDAAREVSRSLGAAVA